jgi:putative nucleotidyltransferase with HDIG domain
MSDPARFLTALTRALSTLGLYGEDHRTFKQAADAACERLRELQETHPQLQFTFLGEDVLCGRELLHELHRWEWGPRLARGGVERLEFLAPLDQSEMEQVLGHLAARMGLRNAGSLESRQAGTENVRYGQLQVADDAPASSGLSEAMPLATLSYALKEEREAIGWLHAEVAGGVPLPLLEAEAVVRSLSLAMHADQAMVIPLLELKEFDQYTTTHSTNVSVLAMALAEYLELGTGAVRSIGLAALLHDLGKIRVPREILVKPGRLTESERTIMQRHPVEGARLILERDDELEIAAMVAYEHHIMIDGGGYPHRHYPRDAQYASRLVHVCDVYDALRTKRPYRDAWPSTRALSYIEGRAGSEFDPALARVFVQMMREREGSVLRQPA